MSECLERVDVGRCREPFRGEFFSFFYFFYARSATLALDAIFRRKSGDFQNAEKKNERATKKEKCGRYAVVFCALGRTAADWDTRRCTFASSSDMAEALAHRTDREGVK